MFIIGFDPGYDRLGVAIIKKQQRDTLVYSHCFQTNRKDSFDKRLHSIGVFVNDLFQKYPPTLVALERLFFNTNQKTAMSVAEVVGILRFLAREKSAAVFELTPGQVKVALTGNGRARKNDVMRMIPYFVTLPPQKRLDDEYDAIAIALTASAEIQTILKKH